MNFAAKTMTLKRKTIISAATAIISILGLTVLVETLFSQSGGIRANPPVEITFAVDFEVSEADKTTRLVVEKANALLKMLSDEQRSDVIFKFENKLQRTNWSNFPHPNVARAGVMRADMTPKQLAALDALLLELLGKEGFQNVVWQLAADEASDEGRSSPLFGEEYYFISFLGTPSVDQPWMLQFGGHHLAINATVFGPEISFSPMLSGGEPLKLNVQGKDIWITQKEVMAANDLMSSLSESQQDKAIRSIRAINLLLGPGEDNVSLAPEGIQATDLNNEQRKKLLTLIEARLGLINANDFDAKMVVVQAELDQTYFGWWGPTGEPGTAYFRITAPSTVIEYAPQDMDGDPTNHAHNMYRNPLNDYGSSWLSQ